MNFLAGTLIFKVTDEKLAEQFIHRINYKASHIVVTRKDDHIYIPVYSRHDVTLVMNAYENYRTD